MKNIKKQKLPASSLLKSQKKTFRKLFTDKLDGRCVIITTVSFDDECGNGHNSFAITGEIWKANSKGEKIGRDCLSCGCIHEDIAKHFPKLKPFLKWHLTSTDGPMHYVANALYHASARDCHGLLKGESKQIINIHGEKCFDVCMLFGNSPIRHKMPKNFIQWLQNTGKAASHYKDIQIQPIEHDEKPSIYSANYTFPGIDLSGPSAEWYQAPFKSLQEAEHILKALQTVGYTIVKEPIMRTGEGKEPNLEAARSCAVWPTAALSDFTKENLEARLPALMRDFYVDVTSLGFVY